MAIETTDMASNRDLPFYNGEPSTIGGRGWLIVLGLTLLAVVLLISIPSSPTPLAFLSAALFTGLPFAGLAFAAGPHWTAVFRPFRLAQLAQAVGFGLLTLVATFGVGLLLSQFLPLTPNRAIVALGSENVVGLVVFILHAAVQLVGEEAVTILPLLAVLWFCVAKCGLSRGVGLTIAVVVSTIWFAAIHLPTYNWNVVQCLGAIGVARLFLTASYLVTRNIWVSSGAHIVNDSALFLVSFAGGHLAVTSVAA